MPRLSVLQFIASTLDGLTSAQFQPAIVSIMPQVPGDADPGVPQIMVWAHEERERRRTFPHGQGQKQLDHDVTLYVLVIDEPDASDADTSFSALLDAIAAKLRGITQNQQITDNLSGQVSWIVAAGEDIHTRVDAIRTTKDERYVIFQATVTTTVQEQLQA
jgi:hypothetical protein